MVQQVHTTKGGNMRRMKKAIAMGLATMMTISLAACGNTSGETTQETSGAATTENTGSGENLTFSWWGNQTRNDMTMKVIDMYCAENAGVSIDGQFSTFSDYWEKLATYAAGNSLPDVIQMDYKYLQQYADKGLLISLDDYIESGLLDVSGMSEDNLNIGAVDGSIYGICLTVSPPAMIYNATLLNENGIEIHDNMTLDEFFEKCREVYEKTGVKTNISYNDVAYLEVFMRAEEGGSLYGDGALGCKTADPLVEYFKIYEKGIEEGWLISADVFAERSGTTVEQDPLVYGETESARSWCAFKYNNQITTMQNVVGDEIDLEMTTYPTKDPKLSNYCKPSQLFCVTRDTSNVEESVKFINYLLNSVDANKVILTERGIQTNSVVSEAIKDSLGETDQKAITYMNDVVIPNSSAASKPQPDGAVEVAALANELVEKVCYGAISAEDAGNQLFEKGNQIMADAAAKN